MESIMFSSAKSIAAVILFGCALVCFAQRTPPASWVYSTYLGGSGSGTITAAIRDPAGNIYVTGTTTSPDFPTTAGVYEPAYPGRQRCLRVEVLGGGSAGLVDLPGTRILSIRHSQQHSG